MTSDEQKLDNVLPLCTQLFKQKCVTSGGITQKRSGQYVYNKLSPVERQLNTLIKTEKSTLYCLYKSEADSDEAPLYPICAGKPQDCLDTLKNYPGDDNPQSFFVHHLYLSHDYKCMDEF